MKKFNKILSLLLVMAMVLSLAACGGKTEEPKAPAAEAPAATEAPATEGAAVVGEYVDPYASIEDYDEKSQAIYADILGEFQETYEAAKAAESVAERYALMAQAEAKLMEAGVYLPTNSKGGNYAISRVAPKTASSIMWGHDNARYHKTVVTTELIKAADIAEMKAKYAELMGTGTYLDWAKEYLTSKGYVIDDVYNYNRYTSDPKTWDIHNTYRAADSEVIINTFDFLVQYDCENVLQPGLAESWEVSEDGTVYTFHLRPGMVWTDSQGRQVAEVKADDFVAGFQHMLDCATSLTELVSGVVANAAEYISGDITDFAQVGVKAVDDLTVEYTLCEEIPYFITMLPYNTFAPMSREFYVAQGGKFGDEFDSAAASYKYGSSPDTIAYCGPYLVTNFTSENTIVFKANPTYWDLDNMNVKTLTWLFQDGKDATKSYTDTKSGVLSGCGLNSAAVEACKADGLFDEYAYVTGTDATAYGMWMNINRMAYANVNNPTVCVSGKADDVEAQERAKAAMYNQNFRLAVLMGMDRTAYNAQDVGEDLKLASMINSYTPGNFVSLPEDVTVSVNGQSKTYAAGTYYGAMMQDQLDADGYPIKVWDPTAEGGLGSSAQFDGWYSPENAQAMLAKAIEELAAQGMEISAEKPVILDFPVVTSSEGIVNRTNALKQSLEASLGGVVILNLTDCPTNNDWYDATYFAELGYELNSDVNDASGWGPDWGDPNSYLDTILPDYLGSMTKCLGIF